MISAALCYVPADAGAAIELRSFLEANCPLAIEDGVAAIDAGLLDTVEAGLALDVVFVLLSSNSVLCPWPRELWQAVLIDQPKQFRTRMVFVLLEECPFPAVLRKEATFFDFSGDFVKARRSLKRWIFSELGPGAPVHRLPERLQGDPAAKETLDTLLDWPELVSHDDRASALDFAYSHRDDFESVIWIDCGRRSHAGVLGDLAHGLDLRLDGALEQNAHVLREYCAGHRVLLIFENWDHEDVSFIDFGGKASTIMLEAGSLPSRRPFGDLVRLFSRWRQNVDKCLQALGDVESHLDSAEILAEEHWRDACGLCSAAVALLKDQVRLAEAHDLLVRLSSATVVRGDLAAQGQVEWETSWILEAWGQQVQVPGQMAAELTEPAQLSLFG